MLLVPQDINIGLWPWLRK